MPTERLLMFPVTSGSDYWNITLRENGVPYSCAFCSVGLLARARAVSLTKLVRMRHVIENLSYLHH